VRDYLEASLPQFVVGEYWDSLSYQFDGTPSHNQDPHRKRIVNWIEAAGGLATAFDITTKGILHAVFERCEYWRLSDAQGKPPGLMGWWPSRAVTFLENHDTGSTQGHWRFPHHALEQGYVYILTHPGTPTVFYDHLYDKNSQHLRHLITRLIQLRQRLGIHCRSKVGASAARPRPCLDTCGARAVLACSACCPHTPVWCCCAAWPRLAVSPACKTRNTCGLPLRLVPAPAGHHPGC
jgi:hypothetical protein